MPSTVFIVHCIDTEGPLHEPIEATFDRLHAIFGLKFEPDAGLLRRLQAGAVPLDGKEEAVKRVIDPHLLAYKDNWDKVDAMLDDAMSESFRNRMLDTSGQGWVYNWFCVDHVDYSSNPRGRDIGYHNVFDRYASRVRDPASRRDRLHFHYHPHPYSGEAHRCATHWWAASDSLHQVMSRRVIDRQWFPSVNRPGFHVTRPDSHWFLEQHIPFDYASQAKVANGVDTAQRGLDSGRFGDWRRAPPVWQPYHPSADDYQVRGQCRRWIARCLNIGTRYRLLDAADVMQAFGEAREGKPVVLGFTNHDFRDMRPDIEAVRTLLAPAIRAYPEVAFEFAEALDAMRRALDVPHQPPCRFDITLTATGDAQTELRILSSVPTFGPQPWLALRTRAGDYRFDNFDIDEPFKAWRYVFDAETISVDALDMIGVAANNAYGTGTVALINPRTGGVTLTYLNP